MIRSVETLVGHLPGLQNISRLTAAAAASDTAGVYRAELYYTHSKKYISSPFRCCAPSATPGTSRRFPTATACFAAFSPNAAHRSVGVRNVCL